MSDFSDAEVFGQAAPVAASPPVISSHNGGVTLQIEPHQQAAPSHDDGGMSDADVFGSTAGGQAAPTSAHPDFALGLYQGAMKPLDNAARGLEWLAGKVGLPVDQIDTGLGMPSAEQATNAHRAYIASQAIAGKRPGAVGNFLGEVAGTLPFAMGMGPLTGGATSGALLSDAKDLPQLAMDTAIGAAGGKVMHGLVGGIAGTLAPKIDPQLQTLFDAKIPLTAGQMANGTLRRLEDGATSMPMLGDIINGAKARSIMGLNRAVANRALEPIGESLPPDIPLGRQAVAHVGDTLSDRYNKLLPGLTIKADPQFVTDMRGAVSDANLLPDHEKMLGNFVDKNIRPYVSADGTMDGTAMKDVEETLGREIKDWKTSPNPADRKYAGALDDVRGALRALVERNNPAAAQELQNLNRGWAHLAIMEDAASRQGAVDGVFTPAQFEGAVRKANDTVRKRGFARGEALMQDLSDAAKARLPSTVPDSGSPLRHFIEAGVGLGVAKESGLLKPLIKGAVVGGTVGLPYTKMGQGILNSVATMPRGPMAQQMAAGLRYARPVAITGGAAGIPLLAAPLMNSGQ